MKKFLTILWIVIIVGAIFLAIKLFKPTPTDDLPTTPDSTVEQETVPIPNENFPESFTENVALGDEYAFSFSQGGIVGSRDRRLSRRRGCSPGRRRARHMAIGGSTACRCGYCRGFRT